MVYLLPMLQFPKIDLNDDFNFTSDLLEWLSKSNSEKKVQLGEESNQGKENGVSSNHYGREDIVDDFHLISGYLNPPNEFLEHLSEIEAENMSFVGASPEANSFFNAPFPKYLVPYFYQQMMLLLREKILIKSDKKAKFYEFFPEYDKPFKAKTFHAKGLFVKTKNDHFESFLGTIGSGNFADRSYFRDNELNFWVYSKNPKLGQIFDNERDAMIRECRELDPKKTKSKGGLRGMIFNLIMKFSKMG